MSDPAIEAWAKDMSATLDRLNCELSACETRLQMREQAEVKANKRWMECEEAWQQINRELAVAKRSAAAWQMEALSLRQQYEEEKAVSTGLLAALRRIADDPRSHDEPGTENARYPAWEFGQWARAAIAECEDGVAT